MTSLMVRASVEIIHRAEQELLLRGLSREQIAHQTNLAVQLVENFFAGEIVDRNTYELLCQSLNINLDSSEEQGSFTENLEDWNTTDINSLNEQEIVSEISEEAGNKIDSEIANDLNLWNLERRLGYNESASNQNDSENAKTVNLELNDNDSITQVANIEVNEFPNNYQTNRLPSSALVDIISFLKKDLSSSINRQCDRLKIIDFNHPLKLSDLYTEVSLFTSLANTQYIDLNETFANVSPEQYDRFYIEKLQPSRIAANQALEANRQMLLIGGLGSGKTTLLKHWAIAVNNNSSKNLARNIVNRVPLYLPLRSLISNRNNINQNHINNWQPFTGIKTQLDSHAVLHRLLFYLPQDLRYHLLNSQSNNQATSQSESTSHLSGSSGLVDQILTQLLERGAFLLLWDELDEIEPALRADVARQIANFSDRYAKNFSVVATRYDHYNYLFQGFTALEIAPFQDLEITSFASKWFQITAPQKPKQLERFQQLIVTNQPLAEIATKPLFLTYLCNYFNYHENIKNNFYQDLLNLLFTDWQNTKCLEAYLASPSSVGILNSPNQDLSIAQKQDLLSHMAIVSLDRHGYVWQNDQLATDIASCLASSRTLSHLAINPDRLYHSLRWQHSLLTECAKGIHSFVHTALHDYLAAYRIANSNAAIAEKYLLDRIYLKRWHGVIVMTLSISHKADQILQTMKRKIDEIVIKDAHLQSFLTWVNQQSLQLQTPYKAVTIRALYLDIDFENTRSLDRARALDIAHSRSLERARMKAMGIENSMETEVDVDFTINLALNLDLALYFASHPIVDLASALEPDLHRGLQFLRQKLPDPYKNKERDKFAKWWQAKGLEWSKKLRSLIMQHRKGSQDWKFSDNQLKVLRAYHDANKLLIECLNNAEHISPIVKSQIESNLLLPQSEYNILGIR